MKICSGMRLRPISHPNPICMVTSGAAAAAPPVVAIAGASADAADDDAAGEGEEEEPVEIDQVTAAEPEAGTAGSENDVD